MKTLQGTVVSTKMNNTVVVAVTWHTPHPVYKKRVKKSKKYKVDTNGKVFAIGDVVTIVQTRPISKDKYFRVMEEKK